MGAIFPVILSGGSGTRLWPLSRTMYPKQFIRFFDDQTSSFLAAALKRLGSEAGFAEPIIVCNNDHRFLVKDEAERAAQVARTGKLVLFGIAPSVPHIGYGYIRRGAPLAGFAGAYAVDAFTEKPDRQTAAGYLDAGIYFWNSGIFVFAASAFLDELARL